MRVGRARRDALKDMVLRTQVPDLNNFVGAILQAEQLGVSVTKVLTVQAEQMRTVRRQRAEEKAAQLQLKLIFPLAIFIFPALCVVIMGPIWPTLANTNAPGIYRRVRHHLLRGITVPTDSTPSRVPGQETSSAPDGS